MNNPCTIGGWYVASAAAASDMAGAGAEEATAEMAGEPGLFPELANALKNSNILKYWNKAKGWVGGAIVWGRQQIQGACNAMQ